LELHVRGTDEIAQVELINNGRVVLNHTPPGGSSAVVKFVHTNAKTGSNYYYFRIIQADGEIAWGSPVWVRYESGGSEAKPNRVPPNSAP
jgi:hypothetical protein